VFECCLLVKDPLRKLRSLLPHLAEFYLLPPFCAKSHVCQGRAKVPKPLEIEANLQLCGWLNGSRPRFMIHEHTCIRCMSRLHYEGKKMSGFFVNYHLNIYSDVTSIELTPCYSTRSLPTHVHPTSPYTREPPILAIALQRNRWMWGAQRCQK
jgi:hypothetical protein